ncbi:MAG: ABC transporter permease [Eggerthellaceae bacterium]|nr:ABC transporter permease [Eggerthellaceae bacterium]
MNIAQLARANLRHNIGRSAGLAVLVAALAFVALGGALVTMSLQNGLASLEARLGADILVAPNTAKSQTNLEELLIDGVPGGFYMDKSYVEKVAAVEGVEKVSPQYYLATVKAGCCSMPVQIIGFDPETDFSIRPWIARSYSSELGPRDVVTGCNISGTAGSTVMFYGVECRIVARLDETGTALDNAVFATNETLRELIDASGKQNLGVLDDKDPEEVVSTIQVKVANGYQVSDVADYINLYVRGVSAVSTKSMTSGVSDGVAGVSAVIGAVMAVLCIIALVVLVVSFTVAGRHRTREFAVLRVIGATRSMLSRLVITESVIVSALGALAGCAFALAGMFSFGGAIEQALGLPFLAPATPQVVLATLLVFAVALLAGPVASVFSARKLARVDAGQTLRSE